MASVRVGITKFETITETVWTVTPNCVSINVIVVMDITFEPGQDKVPH